MMDLSNPAVLVSGFLVSMVGLGIFMHGRKAEDVKALGIGLTMMIFPMFVHSVLLMWVIGGLCVAGMYFGPRSA